jgi:phosphotransferase system enzyme I (PtsP)
LRALIQAAAGRNLRIMLPMVTDIDEVRQTRAIIERELAYTRRHGYGEPASLMVGAMVEVPALLWQLDGLKHAADFISVGSNDLMQFLTATDRGNTLVAERFDPLSRPFLRVLRQIVRTMGQAIPVTLCGELAGNPLAAITLIGLGYRTLSMSPAAIGPVKAAVLVLDAGKLAGELDRLLDTDDGASSVRPALAAFADAEGIPY